MFKIGEAYTRKQIHDHLGGSVQSFLPTVDGQVVCACLSKDMNPNAPNVVLVGNKPIVMKSAEQFSRQTTPIPVFIKEESNEWKYAGDYTVKKITRRDDGIDGYDLGGRDDIQLVLELEGGSQASDIQFSHSWEIHSSTIAVKHTDKSVFLHHGTGIPIGTREFFEIDRLKEGERLTISLMHNSIIYDAYFILANNRTRLFWKSDFSKLMQNLFPQWYKNFTDDIPIEHKAPVIRFQKHPHDPKKYLVSFIDPSSVEHDIESEKAEENEPRKEGTVKEYYGKRYERIPANRQKAIEIHGTTCSACGFNFSEVYGDRGEGFIEVHHIKPLSQAEEAQYINPATDLLPLCSNCHRMIHRKSDNVLSIEELSQLINKSR
jgi:HNH endonuclease